MKLIEHGIRRCGKLSSQLSAEQLQAAKDSLFFFLCALSNRGVPLWRVQRKIFGIYQGQTQLTLPDGTVNVLNANYRTVTRLTGSYGSSAGGTADYAFDGDIETSCTQTSANGNLQLTLGSDTTVTVVGVLPDQTATLTLLFQSSVDGSTWTTVLTPGATAYVNGEWQWYDINTPQVGQYFRMVETGGATLSIREFVVANNPTEIPMARLNIDQYNDMPNKTFQASQPLQFWLDHTISAPVMNLWPAPSDTFKQVTAYLHRQIEDIGVYTNEVDVPQRWLMVVITALAVNIAMELPDVPLDRIAILERQAAQALAEAEIGDDAIDTAPIMLAPGIRVYTA